MSLNTPSSEAAVLAPASIKAHRTRRGEGTTWRVFLRASARCEGNPCTRYRRSDGASPESVRRRTASFRSSVARRLTIDLTKWLGNLKKNNAKRKSWRITCRIGNSVKTRGISALFIWKLESTEQQKMVMQSAKKFGSQFFSPKGGDLIIAHQCREKTSCLAQRIRTWFQVKGRCRPFRRKFNCKTTGDEIKMNRCHAKRENFFFVFSSTFLNNLQLLDQKSFNKTFYANFS